MIELVLIDVDGTLSGTGGAIHPAVPPALDAARAQGIRLGVCTGRPGMGDALQYARVVSPEGFHVFYNGAQVARVDGARTGDEYRSEMSPASVRALVEAARAHGLALEVYTPTRVYAERRDPLQSEHASLIEIETVFTDLARVDEPVLKVQWVVPDAAMPLVERITAAIPDVEMGTGAHSDMPGVLFGSVTRRGTSKLTAARWLADRYGFGLDRVAMVGDGDGDLELIRHAGLGIAMGNATAAVKAAATRVVAPVDEGGLAEALRIAMGE